LHKIVLREKRLRLEFDEPEINSPLGNKTDVNKTDTAYLMKHKYKKDTRTTIHTQTEKRIKEYKLSQPVYNFESVQKTRIEETRSKYNNYFKINKRDKIKTFDIDDRFPRLIQEFEKRGWQNSTDYEGGEFSFDFSFTMRGLTKEVIDNLGTDQIICAFKGMHLTSKNGMMRLLKKAAKT